MAFQGNSDQSTLTGLSIGIDKKKMEDYKERLKLELLTEVKEVLDKTEEMQKVIDESWQGESRDKFYEDFNQAIRDTEVALEREEKDLEARLDELTNDYLGQDRDMYQS